MHFADFTWGKCVWVEVEQSASKSSVLIPNEVPRAVRLCHVPEPYNDEQAGTACHDMVLERLFEMSKNADIVLQLH
jgi:hypothetical protein